MVARRTSIRSLLGKLLLQGEVATGSSPGIKTIQFADDIMSLVDGSLYAGDTFAIALTPERTTAATLNGHLLAVSEHDEVFYYFLNAWVGEKGPSTAFRNAMLSPRIDTALLTVYSANQPSADRQQQVAAWLEQTTVSSVNPDRQSAPTTPSTPATEEIAEIVTANAVASGQISATRPVTAADAGAERKNGQSNAAIMPHSELKANLPARPASDPAATPGQSGATAAANTTGGEGIQLAMAAPVHDSAEQVSDVQAVDVIEYSERLGLFNSAIIKRVYAEIRYPRAAVRRSLQGELELDVTLDRSGALVAVDIAQSSGYTMLDKSAVSAANKALTGKNLEIMDPVAIAEYGNGGDLLVVPVPVSFILTE